MIILFESQEYFDKVLEEKEPGSFFINEAKVSLVEETFIVERWAQMINTFKRMLARQILPEK